MDEINYIKNSQQGSSHKINYPIDQKNIKKIDYIPATDRITPKNNKFTNLINSPQNNDYHASPNLYKQNSSSQIESNFYNF